MKNPLLRSLLAFLFASIVFLNSKAQTPQLWGLAIIDAASPFKGKIFKINGDGTGFTVMHTFNGTHGRMPSGDLLLADNGKFYGVASNGGAGNNGVLFSFDPVNNIYTDEQDFAISGWSPFNGEGLIQGSDGLLYGTAQYGNPGSGITYDGWIYRFDINTPWVNYLYNFLYITGAQPGGKVLETSPGIFHGLTGGGSGVSNYGALYRYDANTNTYTNLYNMDTVFSGVNPWGSLIQINDKLYGMTTSATWGRIFSFQLPSGPLTVLHSFTPATGHVAWGSLMKASDGKLYGMTSDGGTFNQGVIFSLDLAGPTYSVLKNFDGSSGSSPEGKLIQASDGKLYGMTHRGGNTDDGVVFSFDINSGIYTKIHDFNSTDGRQPNGSLTELVITGTKENDNTTPHFVLYPQPSNGVLNVKSRMKGEFQITVYTISGEVVYTDNVTFDQTNHFDFSSFPTGMYLLEIKNDDTLYRNKFIKQ